MLSMRNTVSNAPLFALLLLVLVGCPESDDADGLPDNGLKAYDILYDQEIDQPKPDVPNPKDEGGTSGTEVTTGCASDQDCSETTETEACQLAVCDTDTGTCSTTDAPDASPCDDEDACTVTECKGGECVVQSNVDCDDNNACTADSCNPQSGCINIETNLPCDDGDPCTQDDKCFGGACIPGSLVCALGTKDNPADSCAQINDTDPSAASGVYYIIPASGGAATQVYCELDTAGGGWLRIGIVKGEIPVCSYENGFGNLGELLGTPSTTTVMPASYVDTLISESHDILVKTSNGATHFTSLNPEFTWSGVANGDINANNLNQYGVYAAVNGAAAVPVNSAGICGVCKGPTLMGGKLPTGGDTVYLGVGAAFTSEFSQGACTDSQSLSAKGYYQGAWSIGGEIFIR